MLTRVQRDALYLAVTSDLTGIGDIYIALARGDVGDARRLRLRYGGEMRLLDDLGWGPDDPGEEFAITMPAGTLARTLRHLNQRTADSARVHVDTRAEEEQAAKECIDSCAVVGELLAQMAEYPPTDEVTGW